MRRLLAVCALTLVGCLPKSDLPTLARQPALEVVAPNFLVPELPDDETRRLSSALVRSLERSIVARGYEPVGEGKGAPLLRSTWVRDAEVGSGREPAIGISFSVFAPDGRRLFSVRSVRGLPARAWTEDRVTSEVAQLMRGFPERRP